MAIKLVKEVNLIDREFQETVYANVDMEELVAVSTTNYNGTASFYFEFVVTNSHGSSIYIYLHNSNHASEGSYSVPDGVTNQRYRIAITPNDTYPEKHIYIGRYLTIRAARILIMQDAGSGITATESQIEIGSYEADLYGTSWKACTYPKYWYYNSANWDGTVSAYGEVVWVEADDKYAFSAKLQKSSDQSTWYDVTGGLIVDAAASETVTRTRQSSPFTLDASYPYYRLVHMNTGDKAARGYSIFCAKIIVKQTGTITKTESTFLLANSAQNTTGLKDFDQYYDAQNWEDVTVNFYHEGVAKTANMGIKLQSDPNGTPADVTNSSVTVTADQMTRGGSAMTMVDDKEYDLNITSVGSGGYLNMNRVVAIVVTGGATYKDFSGTAALASNVPSADINRLANFLGSATLASDLPSADLNRLMNTSGTAALASNCPDAALVRMADYSGSAALASNTPDAILSRMADYVGSAALNTSIPDATLNRWANFAGSSNPASDCPDALLSLLINMAGSADLATNCPDALLGRLMNTSGAAALATDCPDAILSLYLALAGTAALSTNLPDVDLSRLMNTSGLAALATSTPDAILGRLMNTLGAAALATDCPDALLGRIMNTSGISQLVTDCPDCNLSLFLPLSGTAALATNTPDADLNRLANFAGTSALQSQTLDALLSRLMNTGGSAVLSTNCPDVILSRLMNLLGNASLNTNIPDADLSLYIAFAGIAGMATDTPDAILSRIMDTMGQADLVTNCPDCDLTILGGVEEGGFYILLRRRRRS